METLFDKVYNSYKKMIISASGWRKVFALDGDENSMNGGLSEQDSIIAAGIGHIFSEWACSRGCRTVAIGRDARPTGEAICRIIASIAQQKGLKVRSLSIAAAPEIMAYVKKTEELDCLSTYLQAIILQATTESSSDLETAVCWAAPMPLKSWHSSKLLWKIKPTTPHLFNI